MSFHLSYQLAGVSPLPLDVGIFFGGIQHSPVDGSSAASCNFSVLAREDKRMSSYSVILIFSGEYSLEEYWRPPYLNLLDINFYSLPLN